MAKAIVLKEYGKSEVLKLEDIKVQKPQVNEISIKQTAIGVHFHDVYVRSGLYKTLSLPGIPGLEAAGVVEEVGKEVTNFKPGDRVGYITKNYGAYTSHRNLDHKIAIKIPKNISTELIATNFSRAITVQMLMEEVTNVKANDIILITAITGGVGKIFSQWAKSIGALVIGSVSSKEKALLAKSYGCDYALVYDQPDFISKIMDITNGKGVDKVFDSVGKDTFENSIKSIRICGHLVNFGQSSGPVEPLLMSTLASKSLTVSRPILFDYISNSTIYKKMTDSVFNAFENNKIIIPKLRSYKLEDANLAHDLLESRQGGGSIFLTP
ncbi:quinone oxidoreductase [Alphaproteobacteria bacterium]|nr:quinone oxidoreductase [Alphaproteobacteria bacterium]